MLLTLWERVRCNSEPFVLWSHGHMVTKVTKVTGHKSHKVKKSVARRYLRSECIATPHSQRENVLLSIVIDFVDNSHIRQSSSKLDSAIVELEAA